MTTQPKKVKNHATTYNSSNCFKCYTFLLLLFCCGQRSCLNRYVFFPSALEDGQGISPVLSGETLQVKYFLLTKCVNFCHPNARGIIQDSEKHLNESGHPTSARQKWDKSYRLLLWSKTRGSDDKCMKSVICFKNIYLSNLLQIQPIEIWNHLFKGDRLIPSWD